MRKIIIPVTLVVLVGGLTALVVIAGRNRRDRYDERQLMEQGKGFQYAMLTMLIYNLVEPFCELMIGRKFMDANVALWLSACLGLVVFAVYCVIKDAYVTVKKSPWVQTLVMGLFAVTYTASAFLRLDGGLIKDGKLTVDCANFAIAADLIIIFLTLLIKTLRDRRNRE